MGELSDSPLIGTAGLATEVAGVNGEYTVRCEAVLATDRAGDDIAGENAAYCGLTGE